MQVLFSQMAESVMPDLQFRVADRVCGHGSVQLFVVLVDHIQTKFPSGAEDDFTVACNDSSSFSK